MRRLLFLGTGDGMPLVSSCSSILVEDDTTNLLLDAGGGHDLLGKFHAVQQDPASVQNVFISHYDSDHILGIVPLIRAFHRWSKVPMRRKIFCSQDVKNAIDSLFAFVAKKHWEAVLPSLDFVILSDRTTHQAGGWSVTFFDTKSKKSPEYGCVIDFPDGTKLAFLGDEPLREHYQDLIQSSDILIHEAFCLDAAQDHFEPHPKHHGTVKETALNAARVNAKKLVLFHMEDETLVTRKEAYAQEVREHFSGEVFVPVDLDTFKF